MWDSILKRFGKTKRSVTERQLVPINLRKIVDRFLNIASPGEDAISPMSLSVADVEEIIFKSITVLNEFTIAARAGVDTTASLMPAKLYPCIDDSVQPKKPYLSERVMTQLMAWEDLAEKNLSNHQTRSFEFQQFIRDIDHNLISLIELSIELVRGSQGKEPSYCSIYEFSSSILTALPKALSDLEESGVRVHDEYIKLNKTELLSVLRDPERRKEVTETYVRLFSGDVTKIETAMTVSSCDRYSKTSYGFTELFSLAVAELTAARAKAINVFIDPWNYSGMPSLAPVSTNEALSSTSEMIELIRSSEKQGELGFFASSSEMWMENVRKLITFLQIDKHDLVTLARNSQERHALLNQGIKKLEETRVPTPLSKEMYNVLGILMSYETLTAETRQGILGYTISKATTTPIEEVLAIH